MDEEAFTNSTEDENNQKGGKDAEALHVFMCLLILSKMHMRWGVIVYIYMQKSLHIFTELGSWVRCTVYMLLNPPIIQLTN